MKGGLIQVGEMLSKQIKKEAKDLPASKVKTSRID